MAVEAVASVLAQTRPADEIIVVDDGSSDDTAERMSAFGNRIRYLRKENGGVSSARNLGVTEAQGDWIAFLDADDVWHPRKLEIQCAALARRSDLALLGNKLYDWPGEHPAVGERAEEEVEAIRFDDLIVRNCLVTSTIVAKTEVLQSAGPFDLDLQGPEDYDMWLRVAQRAKVANLSIALTGYRAGTPGSLSKNAERMETGMRSILGKLERVGVFHKRPLLRRKAWGYFHYSCGFMRFRAGQTGSAVRHLVHSLIGYPLAYEREIVRLPFGRARLLATSTVATIWKNPRQF